MDAKIRDTLKRLQQNKSPKEKKTRVSKKKTKTYKKSVDEKEFSIKHIDLKIDEDRNFRRFFSMNGSKDTDEILFELNKFENEVTSTLTRKTIIYKLRQIYPSLLKKFIKDYLNSVETIQTFLQNYKFKVEGEEVEEDSEEIQKILNDLPKVKLSKPESKVKLHPLITDEYCSNLRGLNNVGDSCYLDSVLFALLALPCKYIDDALTNPIPVKSKGPYLCSDSSKNLSYVDFKNRNAIRKELLNISFSIKNNGDKKTCSNLRNLFDKCPNDEKYNLPGPKDASEFLGYILEILDINYKAIKKFTTFGSNDVLSKEPSDLVETSSIVDNKSSIIQFVETETLNSESTLATKDFIKIRNDTVLDESNKLQNKFLRKINITELIETPYLIFSLKRIFKNYNISTAKGFGVTQFIDTKVTPSQSITLGSGVKYSLSSIIVYENRHYVCYYKCGLKWYLYNDFPFASNKLIGTYEELLTSEPSPITNATIIIYGTIMSAHRNEIIDDNYENVLLKLLYTPIDVSIDRTIIETSKWYRTSFTYLKSFLPDVLSQEILDSIMAVPDLTLNKVFGLIANITSYLQEWSDHDNFKNKLIFFKPDKIIELNPGEKLPLVFYNPNVPLVVSNDVEEQLLKSQVSIIKYLAIETHNLDQQFKLNVIPQIPIFKGKIPSIVQLKCTNNVTNENIIENILYIDNKNVLYCFNIFDFWKQIKNKNYENPYSPKKISKEFINRFLDVYNVDYLNDTTAQKTASIKKTLESFFKGYVIRQSLTPNLIDLIVQDIAILQMNNDVPLETIPPPSDSGIGQTCDICSEPIFNGFKIVSPDNGNVVNYCSTKCATDDTDDDTDD